jgi:DNA-directed RNA polymerase subunit L
MVEVGAKQFKDGNFKSLSFEVRNVDVSVVNSLRRSILSDIECLVFRAFPYNESSIQIEKNTTKFNNEYIKHRLACIPICNNDTSSFENYMKNYVIELDEVNDTMEKVYVTTKNLKIKNKNTGEYLENDKVRSEFFPPDEKTGDYIIICTLYPNYNKKEEKEALKFEANFAIGKAKENSCWNVAHTCAHECIQDEDTIQKVINSTTMTKYEEVDFRLLDAQRIVHKDEYKFTVESLDIYNTVELVEKACDYIIGRLRLVIQNLTDNDHVILTKEAIEYNATDGTLSSEKLEELHNAYIKLFSYDGFIVIEIMDDDYTIGKLIEKYLYKFHGNRSLSFIGFKKEHPTTPEAFIYLKFAEKRDEGKVYDIISETCGAIIKIYEIIKDNISKK